MRGRLLAAMQDDATSSPYQVRRAVRGGGYLAAIPERMRFSLTVALVAALGLAVFLVPVPRLFHFGPGGRPAATGPVAKLPVVVASAAQVASGHWSTLPPAPIAPRSGAVVVWTGSELFVWGGTATSGAGTRLYSDGAAYDPSSRTWSVLAASPLSPRSGASAIWTGSEVLVFGGEVKGTSPGSTRPSESSASYDPSTNTWQSLPSAPFAPTIAVWTGKVAIVLGARLGATSASQAADYVPTTSTWQHIVAPVPPKGHQLNWHLAAAAGDELLAFSDWSETKAVGNSTYEMSGGADLFAYSFATSRWKLLPSSPNAVPGPSQAIWTGRYLVVRGDPINCGDCSQPSEAQATALYDPSADSWSRISGDPLALAEPDSVWTGESLFSLDTDATSNQFRPGAASVYDPADRQWSRLGDAPFGCDNDPAPIWTGSDIVVYCPQPGDEHVEPAGLAYAPQEPGGSVISKPMLVSHFDPLEVSVVGTEDIWALGSVPCGRSLCPAILGSSDGGAHFVTLAAPKSRLEVGREPYEDLGLYFADAAHGFVYGPGLWATDDGGHSWAYQHLPGTVMAVGSSGSDAYALVCTRALASCAIERPDMELLRAPIVGGRWTRVFLPAPLYFNSSLAIQGRTIVLTNGLSDELGDHPTDMVISLNGGRSFRAEATPCFVGLGGRVYPALTPGGVLWAACPTGMEAEALVSRDGGLSWHKVPTGGFDNALTVSPASAGTALIWPAPPSGGLALTTNGGHSFLRVFGGEAPLAGTYPTLIWAGYATASRAYLLDSLVPVSASASQPANEIWRSDDGGRRWTELHLSD
jgi:N-acetylneuraminic acid mutarotase